MSDAKYTNDIWAYWRVLLDERVRTYVVVTAAALLVIFVAQLMTGSLIAGGLPFAVGLLALALRWVAMPVVCVVAVVWFQALPFGVPIGGNYAIPTRATHFRLQDLLLGMAVVVYLVAQFRVYSLAHLAVPDERQPRFRRKSDKPDLRDPDLIDEAETPQLIVLAAVALVAGQLAWLAVNELVLDFHLFPPIRLRPASGRDGSVPLHESRFLLFVLAFGVGVFLLRLGFWYWRLRTLSRAEGQLVLADTGWTEMRREAARQETWRAWGKYRSREAPPKPKPKRREPGKPWVGAAMVRAFLIVGIAFVVTILMVCAGVWLMESRRRF